MREVAERARGVAHDDLARAQPAAHARGDDEDEQLDSAAEGHGHEQVVRGLGEPLQAQYYAPQRVPLVVEQPHLQDESDGLDGADGDEVESVGLRAREVGERGSSALGQLCACVCVCVCVCV